MNADKHLLRVIQKNPALADDLKVEVMPAKIRQMILQAFKAGHDTGVADAMKSKSYFEKIFGK